MANNSYQSQKYAKTSTSPDEETHNSTIWLVSFTDVVALMLTFFVLIFSMSSPSVQTFNETVTVMTENSNTEMGAPDYAGSMAQLELSRDMKSSALSLSYLESLLQDKLERIQDESPRLKELKLIRTDSDLFIAVPGNLIRNKQDELRPLSEMLSRLNNDIVIYAPANPAKRTFAQSLMKAAAMAKILNELGYSRKIAVKTFSPQYSKGLSGKLHIAIMSTKTK